MQQALLTLSETHLQMEKIRSEVERLRSEMYETLRYQNDINEMVAKEQNIISAQLESLNDAMAQLRAETNQRLLDTESTSIGFVVRKND